MEYKDPYFYNRDNSVKSDFVYQTGLASTGVDNVYRPIYGSSVQYSSKLNFFESTNNSLKALPASENNLTAIYSLKYLLTESEAGNLLRTIETAGGYKFLKLYDSSNIYKNMVGTVTDYEVIKLNKAVTEFRLQLQSSVYCPLFDWRTSSFLKDINSPTINNLNIKSASLGKPWTINSSYKKYDFVYVQTNFEAEILPDSFYFAKNDIPHGKNFDTNDWSKKFIYDFKGQFDLKNKIDVFTSDFKNSFHQNIKYRENSNVLKSFSLKFENIDDLQCISMLFFLEKRCGYRRFKYDFPFFLKKEKVFICTQWAHTFKYNNCHDIDVTFIEDPNAITVDIIDDAPVLLSTNIVNNTVSANIGNNINLTTTFRSSTPISYAWYLTTPAPSSTTTNLNNDSNTLSLSNVSAANVGTYKVVATNSVGEYVLDNIIFNVNYKPIIIYNLSDQYIDYGNSNKVTFTIGISAVNQSSIPEIRTTTYKWYYKDSNSATEVEIINQDSNLSISADRTSLTVNPIQNYFKLKNTSLVSRTYYAKLSNQYMITNNLAPVVSSVAGIISNSYITKPTISSSVSIPISYGSSVTLTVSVSGFLTLSYQWAKDGVTITGATSSTYTISNINEDSTGKYTVSVTTNNADAVADLKQTVTSDAFLVSTSNCVKFNSNGNISNSVSDLGQTATFACPAVTKNKNYNLNYQWYKNGILLNTSTSKTATLSLPNITASDCGYYYVVLTTTDITTNTKIGDILISNPASLIIKNIAPLVVYAPTSIETQKISYPLVVKNIKLNPDLSTDTFLLSDLNKYTVLIIGNPTSYEWSNTVVGTSTSTLVSTTTSFNLINLSASNNNLTVKAANSVGSSTSSIIFVHILQAPVINGSVTFANVNISPGTPNQIYQVNSYGDLSSNFQYYSDGDVTITYFLTYLTEDENGNITETAETKVINETVVSTNDLNISINYFTVATKTNTLDNFSSDVLKYSKSNIYNKYLSSIYFKISNQYGDVQTSKLTFKIMPYFDPYNYFFKGDLTIALMEGLITVFPIYVYGLKLTYTWYKNGVAIANSNRRYLVLNKTAASDIGSYTISVTSGYDSSTKTNSTLSLTITAKIIVDYIFPITLNNSLTPPVNNYYNLYPRSRFLAVSSYNASTIPLKYTNDGFQWYFSSSLLSNTDVLLSNKNFNTTSKLTAVYGAITSTFNLSSVGLKHQGSYSVVKSLPFYTGYYLKNSDGKTLLVDFQFSNTNYAYSFIEYTYGYAPVFRCIFIQNFYTLTVIPYAYMTTTYVVFDDDISTKIDYSSLNGGLGVLNKRANGTFYNSITFISTMSDYINYTYTYAWYRSVGTAAQTLSATTDTLKLSPVTSSTYGNYFFLVYSAAGSMTSAIYRIIN